MPPDPPKTSASIKSGIMIKPNSEAQNETFEITNVPQNELNLGKGDKITI